MLKIIIELHPHGRSRSKKVIAEGKIINDGSGTIEAGNYKYQFNELFEYNGVSLPKNEIKGEYKGHNRRDGVLTLLENIFKSRKE